MQPVRYSRHVAKASTLRIYHLFLSLNHARSCLPSMDVEPRCPGGSMVSTSMLFHFDLIGTRFRDAVQDFVSFRFVSLLDLNK